MRVRGWEGRKAKGQAEAGTGWKVVHCQNESPSFSESNVNGDNPRPGRKLALVWGLRVPVLSV